MALGKYPEAVRTANIIARQEQELGNYKVCISTQTGHDFLLNRWILH